MATVAALLIALLGGGFAGSFSHWFGGSAPVAYAAINQSLQISKGIKVTAIKGYVDPKHLVFYYDVSDLSGKYGGGLTMKSTVLGRLVESGCVIAKSAKGIPLVYHCVLVFQLGGGDIAGETFNVTWHISELVLSPAEVSGNSTRTVPKFVQGDWTLRFSLPFHHKVQDHLQISFPGFPPRTIPTY